MSLNWTPFKVPKHVQPNAFDAIPLIEKITSTYINYVGVGLTLTEKKS